MKLLKELEWAASGLKRTPGFVITVCTILGITLAALVCVFTLYYTLMVKALPYPEQDKLYVVKGLLSDNTKPADEVHAYASVVELYRNKDSFDEMGLIYYYFNNIMNLPSRPKMFTSFVTPEFFTLTGAKLAKGRAMNENEGLLAQVPVAVITYQTWQTHYGGQEDILEQSVQINEVSYKIIGVLAKNFVEPRLFQTSWQSDMYLSWDFNPTKEDARQSWGNFVGNMSIFGRLSSDAIRSVDSASAGLTSKYDARFKEETVGTGFLKPYHIAMKLVHFKEVIVGDMRSTVLLLFAGVFGLVLIACLNVSNLFLTRAVQNQRAYTIRAYLGAGKSDIAKAAYLECLIVVGLASTLALLLVALGLDALRDILSQYFSRIEEFSLNTAVVGFTLTVALLLAGLFALLIIRVTNFSQFNEVLQSSGKGSGLQVSKKIRNILICSQISISLIVLVTSFGLFLESYHVMTQERGFDTEHVYHIDLSTNGQNFERDQRLSMMDEIMTRIQNLPSVEYASHSTFIPMQSKNWLSMLAKDEMGTGRVTPNTNVIDEDYFDMINVPIVSGRGFTKEDISNGTKSIIVNETLAQILSPDENMVGKYYYWQGKEVYEVIGVVADIYLPRSENVSRLYIPKTSRLSFSYKLRDNATLEKRDIIDILHNVNPALNIFTLTSAHDAYDELLAPEKMISTSALSLALVTLLLAGVGIFGVLSYHIKLRKYELGVRMSIGASPMQILTLVFTDLSKTIFIGIVSGILLAVAFYWILEGNFAVSFALSTFAIAGALAVVIVISSLAIFMALQSVFRHWPITFLRS